MNRRYCHNIHTMSRFYHTTKIILISSLFLITPSNAIAYKYIEPKKFAIEQSAQILKTLGANDSLLKINARVSDQMTQIIKSQMVQGMVKGTLTKEEWEKKYMRPDVLYIYRLGKALAERAKREKKEDQPYIVEMAEMFLGYGKHFERLKKYGLLPNDKLMSRECDKHIALLSQKTSIHEFYISILTDMVPYVVFANYLLNSIEPSDNNPWIEYAKKYGDLNNKYAREKLSKMIQVANKILANHEIDSDKAERLFVEGFSFEEWFIRYAFSKGFQIVPAH
jgi:thiaminase